MTNRTTTTSLTPLCALLPLLGACATTGSAGSQAPPSTPQQGPTTHTVPVDPTPGHRARIVVSVDASGLGDSWMDLAVGNQADLGREICETLVENQLRVLTSSSLHARLGRPCSVEPLPPREVAAGEAILMAAREVLHADLLLQMSQDVQDLEDAGKVTVTDFATFPSHDACESARAQMEAIRRQDRAAAEEAAHAWLEDQVREQERAAKQACEEKDQLEARCDEDGQAAMERSRCELDRDRATRQCATAQAMLEAVRQRLSAAREAEPVGGPAFTCHGA